MLFARVRPTHSQKIWWQFAATACVIGVSSSPQALHSSFSGSPAIQNYAVDGCATVQQHCCSTALKQLQRWASETVPDQYNYVDVKVMLLQRDGVPQRSSLHPNRWICLNCDEDSETAQGQDRMKTGTGKPEHNADVETQPDGRSSSVMSVLRRERQLPVHERQQMSVDGLSSKERSH